MSAEILPAGSRLLLTRNFVTVQLKLASFPARKRHSYSRTYKYIILDLDVFLVVFIVVICQCPGTVDKESSRFQNSANLSVDLDRVICMASCLKCICTIKGIVFKIHIAEIALQGRMWTSVVPVYMIQYTAYMGRWGTSQATLVMAWQL